MFVAKSDNHNEVYSNIQSVKIGFNQFSAKKKKINTARS